jgi:hypothetical protein
MLTPAELTRLLVHTTSPYRHSLPDFGPMLMSVDLGGQALPPRGSGGTRRAGPTRARQAEARGPGSSRARGVWGGTRVIQVGP